ncbi:XRE family transcriptional regulator [Azotosporobacter soli]|uniref:helix-turn-helix domain-containing protein n=1 Tax=Azotosporobacter soli TaxID=3055040 RepID=UPI0031FE6A3C
MINEIGEKIAALRKSKGLTLKNMSELCGLSISFLSQIENGSSSLAITSLKKIAETLNVPITYFFDTHENHHYHVTLEKQEKWNIEGSPFEYVRLSGQFPESSVEPLLVTLPPNSNFGQVYSHPGEEFVYVLEGALLVDLDGKQHRVKTGESIHYPSTLPHSWSNPSAQQVRVLSVSSPPLFK